MKILTVTTLYPYGSNLKHGVFVETRLRQLQQRYPDVELKVIAPVPWFPFKHPMFGSYASYSSAPSYENRFGIDVYHPRYIVIPKVGMTLTPHTLSAAIYKKANEIIASGYDFDLIDGHYYYPDGVAIAKAAKKLNKPFTITARGTDINLIPQYQKPKKDIQSVLKESNHNMAVCDALRNEMLNLGAEPNLTTTLRNGVDLQLFQYTDETQKTQNRKNLNLPIDSPIIISVGHLIERKGHHHVIKALKELRNITLLIAGDGPEIHRLKRLSETENVQSQIIFLGSLNQLELAKYYGACDVLVLASSREGWANVLLEAMACGTPVVATNIWGTPEVVQNEKAGVLVDRNPTAISKGIKKVLLNPPKRLETRRYAEQFDWFSTSKGQYDIFSSIVQSPSTRPSRIDEYEHIK
ncbi:glycosyltransferase family 4 protein [Photobacterium sp. BZF1]|uniref:glycosyltransferase family 4 protein n=1 Tax=Photobacterium sp. BZF1 TaxID=1904457 RepID=UPI001653538E|nr:glycosyltransferase family 4 protein [Photobacterium sp. BZF1]MBC7004741.1 glycosyltransferase family 4 protein [Photobacterium sp. BZF1]